MMLTWDVAVAGVAEIDDRNSVLLGDCVNLADHLGHLAAWHADVLVELVRVDLAQGR